jgi:hypothetical protein
MSISEIFPKGISNIFSKRQKRASGQTDVYQYDEIPGELRVQIVYILVDLIGRPNTGGSPADSVYEAIVFALRREYGRKMLASGTLVAEQLFNFIESIAETSQVLDVIEVSFEQIRLAYNHHYK